MTAEEKVIELVGGPLCGMLYKVPENYEGTEYDIIYYGGVFTYQDRAGALSKADYIQG
jgi:hypothetical protein